MRNKISVKVIIPLILSILSIITIIIAEIFHQIYDSKQVFLIWTASIFVTISTIFIRLFLIDIEKFKQRINDTNPLSRVSLKPIRFLNFMVISMILALIATIALAFDFIIGMLLYLVTQIALIYTFSGVVALNFSKIKEDSRLQINYLVAMIFWILLIPLIYFFLIFNGIESLVVVPYVIAIGSMACVSWFGFGYKNRSLMFRLMPIIASALFVFSDTLIGNAKFGAFRIPLGFTIDITYVFNVLLMSHSMLFLKDKEGRYLLKQ
ncbi:MAG: membrane protein of unknown function [Promethearchaeota archaeon]|nr:MAG: membrane protein of unknown function [Candidatus Lokiarchaeota archaeon]